MSRKEELIVLIVSARRLMLDLSELGGGRDASKRTGRVFLSIEDILPNLYEEYDTLLENEKEV
jgi:hypothetical protein